MSNVRQILKESSLLHGALPLSSVCNVSCLFCSNKQNPGGVRTYDIPPRPLDEVLMDVPLLRSHQRIVIGESATRVNEGEPYTYKDLERVIASIRERIPAATIAITTNGILVDLKHIRFLQSAGNIEVTLSLNCVCPSARQALMRDCMPGRAINTLRMLGESGVPFHGSVVAAPHVTGWGDLRDTLSALADCGARTIRLFVPGFTRLSEPLLLDDDIPRLKAEAREVSEITGVPVVVEPETLSFAANLVIGVMRDSPAHIAGIKTGDEIRAVDGHAVSTSLDAFGELTRRASPEVSVSRNGQHMKVLLRKPGGAAPGLVMRRDISGRRLEKVLQALGSYAGRSAVVTSVLAERFFEDALTRDERGARARVFKARSRFFGGNIACAGLLTASDLRHLLDSEEVRQWAPGLVIVPLDPFDSSGEDLTGESKQTICEARPFQVVFL